MIPLLVTYRGLGNGWYYYDVYEQRMLLYPHLERICVLNGHYAVITDGDVET